MGSQGSSMLFALTIGINKYYLNTEYPALKGCVADADAVEAYLKSTLSVPASQIISLRNERATRSAIIQGFIALKDDNRIQFGNPILIYFAGHGGLANPPNGWPCSSGKVQVIIPYDCGFQLNGEIVHGIPDLTTAWHLKSLAHKRGTNITVIFDNCFSGSGTRSLNSGPVPSSGIRGVKYRAVLPKTLDNLDRIHFDFGAQTLPRRNNERGIGVASGYLSSGQRSHILLAACRSDEYAREANKRGVFTQALLNVLSGLDISTITYKELLKRIPHLPSNQNPQCEGYEQDRVIFGAQIVTQPFGTGPYEGRKNPSSGFLELKAGAAHGLGKDDVVGIWRNKDDHNANRSSPFGTAKIARVKALSSELAIIGHPTTVPGSFVADLLQSKRPVLYLYVPREPCMQVVIAGLERLMQTSPLCRADIFVSQTLETARIAVIYDGGQFHFDIHDIDINHFGLTRLPHTVFSDADEIVFHKIFHRISIYEYYLRQVKGIPNLEGKVSLSFFRINNSSHAVCEDWNVGEIQEENLAVEGVGIDLIQDRSYYVIKLTNTTSEDLYPSLFYFDNCDYSINSLYVPPSAGDHTADAPLKAGESMIIGYGSEGVSPFVLNIGIRTPHDVEVGFLKLFISTSQYVDYSQIQQESPFVSNSNSRGLRLFDKHRGPNEYFGSIMVPLVVRSPHIPPTRGLELSGIEHRSRAAHPSAPASDRSVFKVVPIGGIHHPIFRAKLYHMMDKLKRLGSLHPHSPFEPLHQQLANLNLSGESYFHRALLEFQEIGKGIAELGEDVQDLEFEHQQSSQDLANLDQRLNRIEWTLRSPGSTSTG